MKKPKRRSKYVLHKTVACRICGSNIVQTGSHHFYCSPPCREEHTKQVRKALYAIKLKVGLPPAPAYKLCAICNKRFRTNKSRKTCSIQCSLWLRYERQKKYVKDHPVQIEAYREEKERKLSKSRRRNAQARKCVICGKSYRTHDGRRATCGTRCHNANKSIPALRRLLAKCRKSKGRRRA